MKHLQARWALIGILLVWLVFSADYFLRGFVPFPSRYLVSFFPPWNAYNGMPVKNGAMPDLITQLYPWRHLTIESWKSGEVPLWNPYSFSGTQHAGNYQSAPFSPFNALFFVLPEIDAWSILILLQPLLAGVFMYAFIKTLGHSRIAAVTAAMSFMFCGFAVVWMGYGTLVHAALWLPLILTGIWGLATTKRFLYAVLIPFGLAASFVSGHFQISLYVLGFAVAFSLYVSWVKRQQKLLFLLAALVVLGILFALPQLVPAYTAYMESSRSANFWNHGCIPFQYLITLFAPDFYGNPVTRNDWFGQYAEWASFAGVIPLILALYAALRKRGGETAFFSAAAVASLLLATPTPLNTLMYGLKIPVLSTSAGSRIIVLFSFSVAVLSGMGMERLMQDWKQKLRKPAFIISGIVVGFLVILWGILMAGSILPADKLAIAMRNSMVPSVLALSAVGMILAGFLKIRNISLVAILPLLLLLFSGADSVRYAKKWMPFEPREYMFPRIDVIQFLEATVGRERIYGTFGNELVTYFGLASIEGYDAVYQARYGEFISAAGDGTIGVPQRSVVNLNKNGMFAQAYLDLLGVRYLVHRVSDGQNVWAYPFWKYPDYVQVYKDPQYEVFENLRAFPRVRLVSGYEVNIHPQEILSRLFSDTFPRDSHIILEQKPGTEPEAGEGTVTTVSETPNTLTLSADIDVPKLLYVSDVYEDGWKAYVDEQEVHVYRANFAFRAVEVPPGTHTIRFEYKPAPVYAAIFISLACMVLFSLLAGRKIRYEYRNRR